MKNLTAFAAASADMASDGMTVEGLDEGPVMVLEYEESVGKVEVRELGGAEAAAESGLYRDDEVELAAELAEVERFCMGVL